MTARLRRYSLLAVAAAVSVTVAFAEGAPETFTATASAKKGDTKATAPFSVTVTRYASDQEREAVMKAIREGGTAALRKVLSTMPDAGHIQLAERRTAIKYAGQRPTGSGRLVTVVTAEPILHLGATLPAAKATAGFDVAVAMLDVKDGGIGLGDFAPAAKVGLDKAGALLIEDYGATVIWLNGVARSK
jgi:hypothetical protein